MVELKVRVIPDMAEFKRQMLGGVTGGVGGVGGKAKGGKGATVAVTGMGKLTGILGAVLAVIKSIDFLIVPILRLLGATISLLFLPLVPILKPLLIGWAKLLKPTATFMKMSMKGWEMIMGTLGTGAVWIWGNLLKPLWDGLRASFTFMINKIKTAWTIFTIVVDVIRNNLASAWDGVVQIATNIKDALKAAFTDMINAIIRMVNTLPGVSIDSVGVKNAPSGNRKSITDFLPHLDPANQQQPNIININNPTVSNRSDIRGIADAVSSAMGSKQKNIMMFVPT